MVKHFFFLVGHLAVELFKVKLVCDLDGMLAVKFFHGHLADLTRGLVRYGLFYLTETALLIGNSQRCTFLGAIGQIVVNQHIEPDISRFIGVKALQ